LPLAGIARGEGCGIGAEKKSGSRKPAGEIGDPKRGADVARMTDYGVETSLSHQLPEAGVVQPEESLRIRAFVGNRDPGIAIKQWDIPLNFCAEFGINSRLSAA